MIGIFKILLVSFTGTRFIQGYNCRLLLFHLSIRMPISIDNIVDVISGGGVFEERLRLWNLFEPRLGF